MEPSGEPAPAESAGGGSGGPTPDGSARGMGDGAAEGDDPWEESPEETAERLVQEQCQREDFVARREQLEAEAAAAVGEVALLEHQVLLSR